MSRKKLQRPTVGIRWRLFVVLALFMIFGVPVIINECYKANCGYITVWDGADVLGYYGTILGAVIAVLTLVATILFTKKQLQRESYLRIEKDKWAKLEKIFLEILDEINPLGVLNNLMGNESDDLSKVIRILQKYQINCKTVCDQLNAHLNIVDYPKFKKLIDSIAAASEEFVKLSQKEIDQYSDLQLLQQRKLSLEILEIEQNYPGSFDNESIAFSTSIIEKSNAINNEIIKKQLSQIGIEFIDAYEEKYRPLLQLCGATFDVINSETQQLADDILRFGRK